MKTGPRNRCSTRTGNRCRDQAVTTLRGNRPRDLPLSFLQRHRRGRRAQSYSGLVLNSVDDHAQRFGVIDPVRANIVSISRSQLTQHSAGFWTVERK